MPTAAVKPTVVAIGSKRQCVPNSEARSEQTQFKKNNAPVSPAILEVFDSLGLL